MEKDGNTRDHLAWNGYPMHGVCVSQTRYLAHGNSEGEARGRSGHMNNSKRKVRNTDERNVGTGEVQSEIYISLRGGGVLLPQVNMSVPTSLPTTVTDRPLSNDMKNKY